MNSALQSSFSFSPSIGKLHVRASKVFFSNQDLLCLVHTGISIFFFDSALFLMSGNNGFEMEERKLSWVHNLVDNEAVNNEASSRKKRASEKELMIYNPNFN